MSCIEDKENTDPHLTKKRRFKAITEEKLDTMSKPQVPKNTEKSSRWAMTNLREWYDDYNDRNSSAKCPEELLSPEASKEVLNTWLCVFITETRGKNSEPYHPKTLQFLLSGILRHMKAQHAHYPNFMDKDDPSFRKFNVTLDNSYRESLENVSTTSVTKQYAVDACKPSTPGVNCSNCTVNFYSGPSVPLPIHPFYQFNPYATYASGNPPFDPTSFNMFAMPPFDQTNVPFSDHHDEQN